MNVATCCYTLAPQAEPMRKGDAPIPTANEDADLDTSSGQHCIVNAVHGASCCDLPPPLTAWPPSLTISMFSRLGTGHVSRDAVVSAGERHCGIDWHGPEPGHYAGLQSHRGPAPNRESQSWAPTCGVGTVH